MIVNQSMLCGMPGKKAYFHHDAVTVAMQC